MWLGRRRHFGPPIRSIRTIQSLDVTGEGAAVEIIVGPAGGISSQSAILGLIVELSVFRPGRRADSKSRLSWF